MVGISRDMPCWSLPFRYRNFRALATKLCCAAWISAFLWSSSIQIPQFHRTPELGFHALLIEGAAPQVELGKPSRLSAEYCAN